MYQTSLKPKDIEFFYNILYLYEKEKQKPKGYNFNHVPLEIKGKITLIHDKNKKKIVLSFPKALNSLCFKGKDVTATLLKHLRNCFAHACIEREGEYYVINSQTNPKCKICGKVKRNDLINLANAIIETKKKD